MGLGARLARVVVLRDFIQKLIAKHVAIVSKLPSQPPHARDRCERINPYIILSCINHFQQFEDDLVQIIPVALDQIDRILHRYGLFADEAPHFLQSLFVADVVGYHPMLGMAMRDGTEP